MFALLGNFDFTELLVIGVGALLIFGRRLPEVAMRAAAQVVRLRRAVSQMWREAGIEEELRRVRREIERDVPAGHDPGRLVRQASGSVPARTAAAAPAGAEAPETHAGEVEPGGASEAPADERIDGPGEAPGEGAKDRPAEDRESA